MTTRLPIISSTDRPEPPRDNCPPVGEISDSNEGLGRLSLSQTSPAFYVSAVQVLLKTLWEKEKLLVTSNFSFFHNIFYPFGEFSTIFIKCEIVVCKRCQCGRVQNLSFGKGLKKLVVLLIATKRG